MPKAPFPANAEGMPKFNRSEVMKKAWELFRNTRARYAQWQFDRGIIDGSFSAALKAAWRIVKEDAATAVRKAAIASNAEARAIVEMIDALKFKSFRHNIARERAVLEAELHTILMRAA